MDMATIMTNTKDGKNYILLGGGYGKTEATKDTFLFGPQRNMAHSSLVLGANAKGRIGWMEIDDVRLVSVDGRTPAQILAAAPIQDEVNPTE